MVIAVKMLNQEGFQGHKEWLTEINYLEQLHHPNLVKLIGYCLKAEHWLLVYEFMIRGSMENHLFRSHLTAKSDIYSFEVVLLEMLSGRRAIDKNRPSGEHNLVEWAKPYLINKHRIFHVLDPRLEGQYSLPQAQKAATLAVQCLSVEAKFRPDMVEMVKELEQLQEMKNMPKSTQKEHHGKDTLIPMVDQFLIVAFCFSSSCINYFDAVFFNFCLQMCHCFVPEGEWS